MISIESNDAFIVVDIQNDFLPGGALAVEEGDTILHGVNALIQRFHERGARVILTQDWHPADHLSFASRHRGKEPFDPLEGIPGIGPVLWPDHCVQGTEGARFPNQLHRNGAHLIIRKGFHEKIDSYSAFTENDRKTDTGLSGYLENVGIRRIFIGGLALDYCVAWSALDGARKGFETFVLPDLSKGISKETTEQAVSRMAEEGIDLIGMKDFKL